MKTTLKTNK